jgi:hypothetical protein
MRFQGDVVEEIKALRRDVHALDNFLEEHS